jgi:hypothetical protein
MTSSPETGSPETGSPETGSPETGSPETSGADTRRLEASSEAHSGRHRASSSVPVRAARTPVTARALAGLGLLGGLVLVGLGAVAVHDVLVTVGALDRPRWIDWTVQRVDGWRVSPALLVVATVIGLVGLLLLWLALRPRRKRALRLDAEAGVYLRRRHLARLVAAGVENLDGVDSAEVAVKGRRVSVRARALPGVDADGMRSAVETTVREQLEATTRPVRPRVRVERRR